ncbi:MAG: CBS domain-containing protein [Caldilineaceae bacterium]|nr:CBS domain-containing protein [Caldilineaceae bacterium]
MLINDCMTRHPVMVSPKTTATEAQQIMTENQIRHLPVVMGGKRLVGLITRQRLALKPDALGSLNVWEITRYLAGLTVQQVMVKERDVITIEPDRTVERGAALMTSHKIGCLPVVEDGVVVGIVTETDLLNSFQLMLGLPSEGVRVTVRIPDQPGEFVKMMGVLVAHNWCVMGIGAFPARRHPGLHDVVVKIPDVTVEEVQAAISHISEHHIVDIRVVV